LRRRSLYPCRQRSVLTIGSTFSGVIGWTKVPLLDDERTPVYDCHRLHIKRLSMLMSSVARVSNTMQKPTVHGLI
jgi:hypothetical protein